MSDLVGVAPAQTPESRIRFCGSSRLLSLGDGIASAAWELYQGFIIVSFYLLLFLGFLAIRFFRGRPLGFLCAGGRILSASPPVNAPGRIVGRLTDFLQ